jgi:polysaccharide biosynthesis/export protein
MRQRILASLMFIICATPVLTLRAQTLEPPKTPDGPLYIIQPNDVLQISVYKEPNLTTKVIVRPDGRISLPLIQDMQAAGLNPGQLKEKLEKGLRDYVEFPIVTVIVEAIQSYRVFVTGKVGKPGMIVIEKPINVLQALTLAGGTADFSNVAEIVIIRNSGEDSTLYRFNYPEVIKGKNFSQNMLLKAGDVVVVP